MAVQEVAAIFDDFGDCAKVSVGASKDALDSLTQLFDSTRGSFGQVKSILLNSSDQLLKRFEGTLSSDVTDLLIDASSELSSKLSN